MKISGVIFNVLGIIGVILSSYMYGEVKLISMTASFGALICGIGFILSYVNFIKLSKLDNIVAHDGAGRKYKKSKAV
ncbi:MAG: hypothetical protein LKE46_02675 [Clostridium sp.]|jgi:multisubunit Na+/H+ antiporter MnhG subunit|uniref:hypothetical protein n=1 Tax=Clostridium sp. TaxID=1506 RepID=UPI0025B988FA|nr:hypothetical protein [Clostridium sp.]MCH3963152.1 hypothetical protein [Clostridium sp.]MCI1716385.1 hypothetical protein [Clostridium sp.]MCI1800725.1 hypothetical protein [Clostridium sp.]MCI1814620.1 hypothetical protein [Clostridium sp.]MCI1871530.1 hypothetical protein [Clostridium sp.]